MIRTPGRLDWNLSDALLTELQRRGVRVKDTYSCHSNERFIGLDLQVRKYRLIFLSSSHKYYHISYACVQQLNCFAYKCEKKQDDIEFGTT